MINDLIILQEHLIYFKETFYIVRNLKNKSEPSPPKPSIQTHPKRILFDKLVKFQSKTVK